MIRCHTRGLHVFPARYLRSGVSQSRQSRDTRCFISPAMSHQANDQMPYWGPPCISARCPSLRCTTEPPITRHTLLCQPSHPDIKCQLEGVPRGTAGHCCRDQLSLQPKMLAGTGVSAEAAVVVVFVRPPRSGPRLKGGEPAPDSLHSLYDKEGSKDKTRDMVRGFTSCHHLC